jgi:septum formation protein
MSLGGWDFSILIPQIDERVHIGELPEEYVLRMARSKAWAVAGILEAPRSPDLLIVAADTAVVDSPFHEKPGGADSDAPLNAVTPKGTDILGKPADAVEAAAMLRRLRGRIHQVYSAIVVLRPLDRKMTSQVVRSDVQMREYSDAEMMRYIASGDPLDKAGAYAIQNTSFRPVQKLSGCYANVMGLPVCYLARLLADFGEVPNTNLAQVCMDMLNYPCPIFQQALGAPS